MKKWLCLFVVISLPVHSAPLALLDVPPFMAKSPSPMTMLIMGRDHKLYYEAYNDASDLNNDGVIDTRFNPNFDYFGYFDSYKCYDYHNGKKRFNPTSFTANKTCSNEWSGNFLNYLTTSRIDAIRKVLYGGKRIEDDADTTLSRAYIPQDAHSWGKEYTSIAVDGYDIRDYAPLSLPYSGKRHLFANTTLLDGNGKPLLRVATHQSYRIWEWVSIERPVAGDRVIDGNSGPNISSAINDYVVNVRVCVDGLLEKNCKVYPNGYFKPTGLLQDFGESDKMKFGLLTGSYGKNLSGGVLRKPISSFTDEIDLNSGQFTSTQGIIHTINQLQVMGFGGSHEYNSNCGFILDRDMNEGECRMWGNPIGEMMYETLRYFAGKGAPTSDFTYSGGDDDALNLPVASWSNPYGGDTPWCSKANMLVISDIFPSYDSDQIPGTAFGSFSGDINMNASSIGADIWSQEFGQAQTHFIGETSTSNDGTPSPKLISSFGHIRGLAPEEPNKEGSYYSASVAYFARKNDINDVQGVQNLHSFAVALASPLPKIRIPVNGKEITLIPFGKSVKTCIGNIDPSQGAFQPTNTIVDFYIESLTDTSGSFRINFEDAQQGADHDMDAIVEYQYTVNPDDSVTISLDSIYAAGCVVQHMGYMISGTTADGTYLEVRDDDTSSSNDVDYFLDTPPGVAPSGAWDDGNALPKNTSRTFYPSESPSATLLNNPLWYVAKYGSFVDENDNLMPDSPDEFDADADGVPDNYFLVTNALHLKDQLSSAFDNILKRDASGTSVALNGHILSANTVVYQTIFNTTDWSGKLLAFDMDHTTGQLIKNGTASQGAKWDASALLDQKLASQRVLLTYNRSSQKGIAFQWPADPNNLSGNTLSQTQVDSISLDGASSIDFTLGQDRLNYLRGMRDKEILNGGYLRNRNTLLGDIIHSRPVYFKNIRVPYQSWPSGSPENNVPYLSFYNQNENRQAIVYVGANDGMLHAFNADTGEEVFAYVPNETFYKLKELSDPYYEHTTFVNGDITISDVFLSNNWQTILVGGLGSGGQGIYALNVTDPSQFTETNAQNLVMWEFSDEDSNHLGYTFGKPQIARLNNGKWGVIVSNGFNNTENDGHISSTGNVYIYILDIEDGSIIYQFDSKQGFNNDPLNQGRPNGMSDPFIVDSNGDQIADFIYAGDLFGNMWKIDISSNNTTNWGSSFMQDSNPVPLYIAKDASDNRQPITTAPVVAKSYGQIMVYFATGKFIEADDTTNTQVQTIYGIFDKNQSIANRSSLLQQSITEEVTVPVNGEDFRYRLTTDHSLGDAQDGWFMDLDYPTAQGERVIQALIVRGDNIIVTTTIPSSDLCNFGGTGWLMELDRHGGARLANSPFDVNADLTFTDADKVDNQSEGGKTSVSGVQSNVGVLSAPVVLTDKEVEYKYSSGSTGNIQVIVENPSNKAGRQSWRQLQ